MCEAPGNTRMPDIENINTVVFEIVGGGGGWC